MVAIRRGDLIKMEGTQFHVKKSHDGVIWFYAEDTDDTYTETFDQFIDRARQCGHIKIVPGEGKYESPEIEDNRDVFADTV